MFECCSVGDAQFGVDIRLAVDPDSTPEFVETYIVNPSAPTATDPAL